MIYFIKQLLFILFFYFSFISKAQNTNSLNGYFVLKANMAVFYDNDGRLFYFANPDYGNVNTKYYQNPTQITHSVYKPNIFPGAELNYYFPRNNFFGFNLGLAFSYDKTYYNYKYNNYYRDFSTHTSTLVTGSGNGTIRNNMFKIIYGFNFNTKFNLKIYIQSLNPELRIFKNENGSATFSTYNGLLYKSGSKVGYDSVSTFISSETKNIEIKNYQTNLNYTMAFPTTIGTEQKFKIGKIDYLAGVSATFSLLKGYAIYRGYIGICFGNFKSNTQPGY